MLEQIDHFLELFPSMTYQDVMDMPYRDFKAIHQIRIKRKLDEQKALEKEQAQLEKRNQSHMSRHSRRYR